MRTVETNKNKQTKSSKTQTRPKSASRSAESGIEFMSEQSKQINDGGMAFPGFKDSAGYGCSRAVTLPSGEIVWENHGQGMSKRDWFAGVENLSEWDNPEAVASKFMCEALAGPMPSNGWSAKSKDEWVAILQWEAKWRSVLRYIRADAMILESEKQS